MALIQESSLFDATTLKEAPGIAEPEARLDSRDVINCFNLFLGRMPSTASADRMMTESIPVVLRELFEMEEFKANVLGPVLLREPLPHSLMEAPFPLWLIDWVQNRLPVKESTRRVVGGTRTWLELLELILADSNLVAISPDLVAADVDSVLRARLEDGPALRTTRSVVGVVDAASAFEMRGWAVDLCDKAIPVILEFYADSIFIGSTVCNEPRPDVRDVVGGSGQFGFTFKISMAHRTSFAGGRTLIAVDSASRERIGASIKVYSDAAQNCDALGQICREIAQLRKTLDRIETRLPEMAHMASIPIEAYHEYWERFYRPSPDILDEQSNKARQFTYRPLISVVVPAWNSNNRLLDQAIESVRKQSYDRWEVIVVDDASDRDELRLLRRRYTTEPRIRWIESPARQGIASNTNRGIAAATGDYIAFLDHDDLLAPDALYYIAVSLQQRQYGLLYSDEDRIEEDELGCRVHHTPFFKPAFDPDLLLSLNYICHLVVLRRDVVDAIGGLRDGFEGAQDHDLLLRATACLPNSNILHVPRVLYHWRVTPGSVSRTPARAEEIQNNIVTAVRDYLAQQNQEAQVEPHNDPVGSPRLFATRVRWLLPSTPPRISIIVATRDRVDLLRPCLESVLASVVLYPGEWEIVLVDNDSVEPATENYFASLAGIPEIRCIQFRGPFNWSAINNAAASEAQGEVLIFLNNDTVVLTKDWCVELVAHALRPDVGAVGARLLYPDGTIQHAGVVLGVEGVAGHEGVGESPAGGYFGRTQLLRSAAAVTGACLATRRVIFEEVAGFDELELKVAFNDVDYGMKVRQKGLRVVYNPFAVLYHLESKSRGREISPAQQTRHRAEAVSFRARWSDIEIADPYYNLHFERFARPFERLRPPPADSDWIADPRFVQSAAGS